MVIWTVSAKRDLRAIHYYIASNSKYYAAKVTRDIREKSRLLSDFPEMGRVVPEIGNEHIRELFIYSYRLIYEIFSRRNVEILAIVHGKQNFLRDGYVRG